jgi:hypothetical protein
MIGLHLKRLLDGRKGSDERDPASLILLNGKHRGVPIFSYTIPAISRQRKQSTV